MNGVDDIYCLKNFFFLARFECRNTFLFIQNQASRNVENVSLSCCKCIFFLLDAFHNNKFKNP